MEILRKVNYCIMLKQHPHLPCRIQTSSTWQWVLLAQIYNLFLQVFILIQELLVTWNPRSTEHELCEESGTSLSTPDSDKKQVVTEFGTEATSFFSCLAVWQPHYRIHTHITHRHKGRLSLRNHASPAASAQMMPNAALICMTTHICTTISMTSQHSDSFSTVDW